MYLKKMRLHKYGPFAKCEVEFEFNDAGDPRPLVLVGGNGSGKTIFLSIALDTFVTMRAAVSTDVPEVRTGKLFKPLKQANRYLAESGLTLSECTVVTNASEIVFSEYMMSVNADGNFSLPDGLQKPENFDDQTFDRLGLSKSLSSNDNSVLREAVFNEVFAYYPTGRAEKPGWLSEASTIEFGTLTNYSDQVNYNSWRSNIIDDLTVWMLDVVLDSELYDITPAEVNVGGANYPGFMKTQGRNRKLLSHINQILSLTIGTGKTEYHSVRLGISERNRGARNIQIVAKRRSDNTEDQIAHSLKDLSTGELAVLCIFADLIRIAEIQGWDRNNLADIRGVALIDEADLHLHIRLQKEILPKLITLMPKIQFVLTTHSPLLALGAAEQGATILNLPTGEKIAATEFSEFDEAYKIFIDKNDQYKDEFRAIEAKLTATTKPLIIAEGKTDKKHLELAMARLLDAKLIPPLELEFYDVGNDMGSGELEKLFIAFAKIGHERPIVCIFDRDEQKIVKNFGAEVGYKLEENVIGLCLAVPDHRTATPEICIEHLYLDETLESCLPGTEKRLRFEHEICYASDKKTAFLKPTPAVKSMKIYDSDVALLGNEDGSRKGEFALSKNAFFEEIVKPKSAEDIDFTGFVKTFEIISKALQEINK